MIVELQKAQRQLQAKTKELTALAGEADRLRKEKTKLEEEAKKFNREKAEKRMVQLLAAPVRVHTCVIISRNLHINSDQSHKSHQLPGNWRMRTRD